jgi:hypothetical protein
VREAAVCQGGEASFVEDTHEGGTNKEQANDTHTHTFVERRTFEHRESVAVNFAGVIGLRRLQDLDHPTADAGRDQVGRRRELGGG